MMHASGVRGQVLAQPARPHRFIMPHVSQALQIAVVRSMRRTPGRVHHHRASSRLQPVQAVYGSQWNTPGDAYVTVVSSY